MSKQFHKGIILCRALILPVVFLTCFISSFTLSAQENQQDPSTTDTIQAPPEIIPATEINKRLPEASIALRNLQNSIISDRDMKNLKSELDTFLLHFETFKSEQKTSDTALDSKNLQGNLYLWNQKKNQLATIHERMDIVLSNLQDHKQTASEIRDLWERALDALLGDEVPQSVRRQVQDFIRNVGLIQDAINLKSRTILSYLEKITDATILTDVKIEVANSKLRLAETTMMNSRGPWIIPALKQKLQDEEMLGSMKDNLKRNLIPFSEFMRDSRINFFAHSIIFFLLWGLFFLARKNFSKEMEDLELKFRDRFLKILNKPFLAALFVALILSFIIYPQSPVIFQSIVLTLLLIPVVTIIPSVFYRKLDWYIYALAVLILFSRASDFILYPSVFDRLSDLIISLIILTGCYKIVKQRKLEGLFYRNYVQQFLVFFVYISMLLLCISVIANITGYYILGEFIVESLIWSFYSILLFYGGVIILAGFVEFSMYSDLFRKLHVVEKFSTQIITWINNLVLAITFTFWLYIILQIFRIDSPALGLIASIWQFGFEVGEVKFSPGNLIIFFVTIWITIFLSKIVRAVLEEDVLPPLKLERGLPRTISLLVRYSVITIGFLIAAAAAGLELSRLTILFGAFGIGIGFGLQNVVNNFISGLILLFERPIQIGDIIKVGTLEGTVKRIGIRASVILTFDRSEVIVPNGNLTSNEVINFTLSNKMRRLEIEVGVAYGSDIEKVMHILKESAESFEEVMEDPAPYVWFKEYGESSIDFRLLFFYPQFEGGQSLRSRVAAAIDKAFKKEGITIPFPQHDLYIKEHPLSDSIQTQKSKK